MEPLITINQAVGSFRDLINGAILESGDKGKEAMIRSSRPIQYLHDAVKSEFIRLGIERNRIFPPLGQTKPELELAGFFKKKNQDVCIKPTGINPTPIKLTDGLLLNETDYFGIPFTEKTISINVRSQISSLAKNFDTLYERTFAEALNLHTRCPKIVMGEVYMIAVPEYDSDACKYKEVVYQNKTGTVEKYIKSFQAINGRPDPTKHEYKYERACLLIVDFSKTPVKIFNTDEELKQAGLLPKASTASIAELTWDTFTSRIIEIHQARFRV